MGRGKVNFTPQSTQVRRRRVGWLTRDGLGDLVVSLTVILLPLLLRQHGRVHLCVALPVLRVLQAAGDAVAARASTVAGLGVAMVVMMMTPHGFVRSVPTPPSLNLHWRSVAIRSAHAAHAHLGREVGQFRRLGIVVVNGAEYVGKG